jgi:hypothetical protein
MKMQLSCGCCAATTLPVTIKGLDKTDGATIWEYGPGSWWSHHYGADAISGIVPDVDATLDRYVASANNPPGNRNLGTLTANAVECLTLTKLDSLDGTVIESATLGGVFCSAVTATEFVLSNHLSLYGVAALSGGDYVIVGERYPAVEFVDYNTNTANKEYILHAHTQQGGNVTLTTRTSSESIVIPYDSTAAEVEALFEATSDCTAATATGGPWPHREIEIDVTWSAAGGDISAISQDSTYSASTPGVGTSEWRFDAVNNVWNLLVDSCTVGTPAPPTYNPGFPTDDFGTCEVTAVTKRTRGAAASYDTGTGLISNSVGEIFGYPSGASTFLLSQSTPTPPSFTSGAATSRPFNIVPAASDVIICGTNDNTCLQSWQVGTTWTRKWTKNVNRSPYTVYGAYGSIWAISIRYPVDNKVLVTFRRGLYDNASPRENRCGAIVNCDTGEVIEELDSVRFVAGQPASLIQNDSDADDLMAADILRIPIPYNHPAGVSHTVADDATDFLIGAGLGSSVGATYSWDGSQIYGFTSRPDVDTDVAANGPDPSPEWILGGSQTSATGYSISGSVGRRYVTTFQSRFGLRLTQDSEFRFRFISSIAPTVIYTSWLTWDATAADIKTALIALFGENTEGTSSNVVVNLFGDPPALDNTTGLIDRGLRLDFLGVVTPTNPFGFVRSDYLYKRTVRVTIDSVSYLTTTGCKIEIRNSDHVATGTMMAWDATDASPVWGRSWGTAIGGSATIATPAYAWSRGDFVYGYGPQVENDL